jgi:signal peptidase I
MAPELSVGQSVLVNKSAYLFGGPSRGDVVVFVSPCSRDTSHPLIGRVIGIPGDTIDISATSTQLDGVTLNEPYVHVPAGQTENATIVAPTKLEKDKYFILDDNRANFPNVGSCNDDTDSRGFGAVPRSNIVGKAVLVFWPLSQRAWISNYSNVFNGIHP